MVVVGVEVAVYVVVVVGGWQRRRGGGKHTIGKTMNWLREWSLTIIIRTSDGSVDACFLCG